jgi:hypothetical protein
MDTIKILSFVILALAITVFFLIRSNVVKSREIKRLLSISHLRRALNGETHLDFREYSLDVIKLLERQINVFLLELFEKDLKEISNLLNSIENLKDGAIQGHLKGLIDDAINITKIERIANLIIINTSNYLYYIRCHKYDNSQIQEQHIKYFKFNSLILSYLSDDKYPALITIIDELIDKREIPDFAGDEPMKKLFKEEQPFLLKAELSKIKMLTET